MQATHHRRLPEPSTTTRRHEPGERGLTLVADRTRSAVYTYGVLGPEKRGAEAEPYLSPDLLVQTSGESAWSR